MFPFRPFRSSPPPVAALSLSSDLPQELMLVGEAVHAGKDRGVEIYAETGAGFVGWNPLGAEEWRVRGSQSGGTPTLCRCDPRLEVSLDDLPGAVTGVARFLCFADSFPNLSFAFLAISSLSLVCLLAS